MSEKTCKNGQHLCGGTDTRDGPPRWAQWTCRACRAEINAELRDRLTSGERAYDAWATNLDGGGDE